MKKKMATGFAVAAAASEPRSRRRARPRRIACSSDGASPGFSWFGTVHVQERPPTTARVRDPGHAGTPGASNCRDTSGSPAERAPGQS